MISQLRKLIGIGCIALLGAFAVGCVKQVVKPKPEIIDAYFQQNPDLPELDKQCIFDGRFEVGVKMETVQFLLGKPDKEEIIHQPWAVQQQWTYNRSGKMIFIIEDKYVVGILQN